MQKKKLWCRVCGAETFHINTNPATCLTCGTRRPN